MTEIWNFLLDEENRTVLTFLGGGAMTVISALWIAFKFFVARPKKSSPPPSVTENITVGQGIGKTGDITINHGTRHPKWAYALGIVGLIVLAYAALNSRGDITVTNGSFVGGKVEGSEINVNGGSDGGGN